MADDNVRLFPRMGAADPPVDPPDDPLAESDPEPEAAPAEAPSTRRRSPLETLAALEAPAESTPATDPDTAADGPADGEIPAMFQSENWGQGDSDQLPDPGLGALSLAAVLAVSVAALRGIHGALTGMRANREQRQTVADLAASGRGDKSSNRRGTIPSSNEFGRRSLGRDRFGNRQGGGFGGLGGGRGNRRGGGGGLGGFFGGGGSGRRGNSGSSGSAMGGAGGRKGGSGSRSTGGLGGLFGGGGSSRRKNAPAGPTGSGGTGGSRSSGGTGTSSGGSKRSGSAGGGPHRTSQGGGWFRRGKPKGPAPAGGSTAGPGSSTSGSKGKPKGPAGSSTGGAKAKGGPKSPKAGTAPKGTLRSKRPKGTSGPGAPGAGAPGGPPLRKRHGKPVTDGSVKLPKGISHGHLDGWNQGCRCPACTRAWALSQTTIGKKGKLPSGIRHGSASAYEDAECRCKKCVLAAIRRRDSEPRVTLRRAVGNTFERRWAKRTRKGVTPPLLSKDSPKARRKAAKKKASGAGPTVDLTKRPRVDLGKKKTPAPGSPPPPSPPGSAPGPSRPESSRPGPSGPGGSRHRRTTGGGDWSREQRRAHERAGGTSPEDDFWFQMGPDGRVRRTTPWEAAAAASAGPERVIKVEQLNKPGESRRRPPGAAPLGLPATTAEATPAKSGAPIPEQRGAGMSLPASIIPGTVGMAAQHDTEVTIDDVLDVLERLTKESFTAHEKSIVIAEQARKIRGQLEDLAEELRTHHNVIGQKTAAAMTRLAESMDVLAAKADEMRTESLNAAEESESTQYAMADEHRPVQQATADANLVVPSARVHNEG
ncbi:hypothetical protein [Streptacidiphilus sp. MAP5-52]|uniref:hypothetical protein n=1 Tax=Streptacidiphilus sp. MAP5-52 TaxID=3156267 RepID=UPI0035189290